MFDLLCGFGIIGWLLNGFQTITWSSGSSTTYWYGERLN